MDNRESAGLTLKQCLHVRISWISGYVIDRDSLHPSQEKLCVIKEVPEPCNIKPFLELNFMPNLAAVVSSLQVIEEYQTDMD